MRLTSDIRWVHFRQRSFAGQHRGVLRLRHPRGGKRTLHLLSSFAPGCPTIRQWATASGSRTWSSSFEACMANRLHRSGLSLNCAGALRLHDREIPGYGSQSMAGRLELPTGGSRWRMKQATPRIRAAARRGEIGSAAECGSRTRAAACRAVPRSERLRRRCHAGARPNSAGRQYAFAIGSSSAGKWVITLQPRSVTTTSSSMRAAEKPSVAGQ